MASRLPEKVGVAAALGGGRSPLVGADAVRPTGDMEVVAGVIMQGAGALLGLYAIAEAARIVNG